MIFNEEIVIWNILYILSIFSVFLFSICVISAIDSITFHWPKIIKFIRRVIRTYRLIRIYLLNERKIKIERSIKARLNKLKMSDSDLIKIIGGKNK